MPLSATTCRPMTNLPGISPQPPAQWQQENRDFYLDISVLSRTFATNLTKKSFVILIGGLLKKAG